MKARWEFGSVEAIAKYKVAADKQYIRYLRIYIASRAIGAANPNDIGYNPGLIAKNALRTADELIKLLEDSITK